MRRLAPAVLAAASLALPGCIIVSGSSSGSSYRGYGSVDRATLDSIVASNAQNRIGDSESAVLARFPAENVSLVRAAADEQGHDVAVYRVYARERYRSTSFERYLVFRQGSLALLTDDRDDLPWPVDAEYDD
jgi:hypothetical protein